MWGHAHLWFGRLLILVGIINGGLGLRLTAGDDDFGGGGGGDDAGGNSRTMIYIAISVTTGIMYALTVLITATTRRRTSKKVDKSVPLEVVRERRVHPPKYT